MFRFHTVVMSGCHNPECPQPDPATILHEAGLAVADCLCICHRWKMSFFFIIMSSCSKFRGIFPMHIFYRGYMMLSSPIRACDINFSRMYKYEQLRFGRAALNVMRYFRCIARHSGGAYSGINFVAQSESCSLFFGAAFSTQVRYRYGSSPFSFAVSIRLKMTALL